jgi:cytochrome c2
VPRIAKFQGCGIIAWGFIWGQSTSSHLICCKGRHQCLRLSGPDWVFSRRQPCTWRLRKKIGEWSILGTGLRIVAVLLLITTIESSAPLSGERSHEVQATASQQLVVAKAPASVSPEAPDAGTNAMRVPEPLSHDHHMPSFAASAPLPSVTTGQGSPAAASGAATTAGDPAAGRLVFRKCQACHSMEPDKNILGPSLAGVIGRKAGSVAGYAYSPAMKQTGIVWDADSLDEYLADPARAVPGNKMPFPDLKTENDRKDVIAFLASPSNASAAAAAPGAFGQPLAAPTPQAPAAQTQRGAGARASPTFPTPATRCVQASPKDEWSILGLAARSTARSIRS